jgi:hypothetical protein
VHAVHIIGGQQVEDLLATQHSIPVARQGSTAQQNGQLIKVLKQGREEQHSAAQRSTARQGDQHSKHPYYQRLAWCRKGKDSSPLKYEHASRTRQQGIDTDMSMHTGQLQNSTAIKVD